MKIKVYKLLERSSLGGSIEYKKVLFIDESSVLSASEVISWEALKVKYSMKNLWSLVWDTLQATWFGGIYQHKLLVGIFLHPRAEWWKASSVLSSSGMNFNLWWGNPNAHHTCMTILHATALEFSQIWFFFLCVKRSWLLGMAMKHPDLNSIKNKGNNLIIQVTQQSLQCTNENRVAIESTLEGGGSSFDYCKKLSKACLNAQYLQAVVGSKW